MTDAPRTIDCDVHVRVPSVAAIRPYLDDHWWAFLEEMSFRQPAGYEHSYPAWLDPGATASPGLEDLRAAVLDRSAYAILNCHYSVESMRHPFLAAAMATAVNAWLGEEWLDRDPRLRASAVIAPNDSACALAELERIAADGRFVQLYLPARVWEPYGNRRYWPLWEAAAAHGIVLGLHFGGAAAIAASPVGGGETYFEEYVLQGQLLQSHLLSLIAEGVFDEFPDLRVNVSESGATWLQAFLWKMDTEWKALRREVPWLREPPSEYLRRHVRLSLAPLDAPADDRELEELVHAVRLPELLMYSSNYPFAEQGAMSRLEALLPVREIEQIRWSNAAALYGLDAPVPSRA